MNMSNLHIIGWHLHRLLAKLGLPGTLGLGLLLASTIFCFSVLLPLKKDIDELRTDIQQYDIRSEKLSGIQINPAQKLGEFYSFFPGAETTPDRLAIIYKIAAQQNINLEQGEYRLVRDQHGKILRYEINFPVKGSYIQIRKFLSKTLAAVPNLSLDNISFSRQKITDVMLESQLKMTLYITGTQ